MDRPEHRLGARSGGCGERVAAARCCSGGVAAVSADRELLELAAKAVGLTGWRYAGPSGLHKMINPSQPETTGSIGPAWNPLTDDGDALRLAVKLHIDVLLRGPTLAQCIGTPSATVYAEVPRDDNANAATRRAIVIAAAEIGRVMP